MLLYSMLLEFCPKMTYFFVAMRKWQHISGLLLYSFFVFIGDQIITHSSVTRFINIPYMFVLFIWHPLFQELLRKGNYLLVNPLLSTGANFYNTWSPNREGDLHRTISITSSRHIVMQYEYFSCEKCQVHLYPSYYLINKRACLGIRGSINQLWGDCERSGCPDSDADCAFSHLHPTWMDLWWSHPDAIVVSCRFGDLKTGFMRRPAESGLPAASFPHVSYQVFSAAAHWSVSLRASH